MAVVTGNVHSDKAAKRRITGNTAPVHFDLVGTEAFNLAMHDTDEENEVTPTVDKRKSTSSPTALPATKRIRITTKRPG